MLFEPRAPPAQFWLQQLVSSRLLEFEVWNRVHAYGLAGSHAIETMALLTGIEFVEMERPVLASALQPSPVPLRTLDALHLATVDWVRRAGNAVELASYDNRLIAGAQAIGIPIAAL